MDTPASDGLDADVLDSPFDTVTPGTDPAIDPAIDADGGTAAPPTFAPPKPDPLRAPPRTGFTADPLATSPLIDEAIAAQAALSVVAESESESRPEPDRPWSPWDTDPVGIPATAGTNVDTPPVERPLAPGFLHSDGHEYTVPEQHRVVDISEAAEHALAAEALRVDETAPPVAPDAVTQSESEQGDPEHSNDDGDSGSDGSDGGGKTLAEFAAHPGDLVRDSFREALESDFGTDANPFGPNLPARRQTAVVLDREEIVEVHRERASAMGWPFVDLDADNLKIPDDALALLKAPVARKFNAVPVRIEGRRVTVAVEDPSDALTSDGLRPHLQGYTMRLAYADPAAIRRQINVCYSASAEASALAREAERRKSEAKLAESNGGETDMGRIADSIGSETVRVLRLTIEQALRDGASDIHIEPTKHELLVRYRINGKLLIANTYPRSYERPLLTKIKVDSPGMHTDNFLVPDSGVLQYQLAADTEPVDIRVEIAPTAWGSVCTMRLQQNIWRPLDSLGFTEANERRYRRLIAEPYGILLATGPTGSGKSTTLYASVREQISETTKIITLENPIEYKVPKGVTQIMVNEQQGMTFASGLRSILRQDPNIILVGEIRDQETAETAIDAAMTGHQVFSTLHTNDAPEIVTRLLRMGIEPFMLSTSLLGVVGQRLVGRLCANCRVPRRVTEKEVEDLGFDPALLRRNTLFEANPRGCQLCRQGLSGRIPIHEVLISDHNIADAIAEGATQHTIRDLARAGGMTSMREDGWEKILAGVTSISEVNENTRREH